MTYVVNTTYADGRNYEYEWDDLDTVTGYVSGGLDKGQTVTVTRKKDTRKRKVARFTLLAFGKVTGGDLTQNKTAEEYGSNFYGYDTIQRLQGYLDTGQEYKVNEGQSHSVIPDLKDPEEEYGHRYSVRIDSITEIEEEID